jgi:hypothetical protein
MNPRPILIATCATVAFMAFVYFFGKQHFSPSRVSDFGRSTVDTPESPSNAIESEKRVDSTVDRATQQPSPPVQVDKSPTRDSTVTSSKVVVENSEPLPDTVELSVPLDSESPTDPLFSERVRLFNEYMALINNTFANFRFCDFASDWCGIY